MIQLEQGNLLEADAEALVNTVNCVGVMGKGIALQFKQAYPDNFRDYERACNKKQVTPGQMFVHATGSLLNPKYIINFPTKRHWKGKSHLEDIVSGLTALVADIKKLQINSVAVPPLGCGNGGLEWSEVQPLIEAAFNQLPDIKILLFGPTGAPAPDKMPTATRKPKITRSRALLIRLLEIYGIPGYKLTLLEIQKLAYFLQIAGEPLKLAYVAHTYGPYADKLNHALQNIEGHYIRGYGDRSRTAEVMPLPEGMSLAHSFLLPLPDALEHIERVRRLIEGFESPYGMELLATVHWVATHDLLAASDPSQIVAGVHSWNSRKKAVLTKEHIEVALKRLTDEHWL